MGGAEKLRITGLVTVLTGMPLVGATAALPDAALGKQTDPNEGIRLLRAGQRPADRERGSEVLSRGSMPLCSACRCRIQATSTSMRPAQR